MRTVRVTCDLCNATTATRVHLWVGRQLEASGSETELIGNVEPDLCLDCLRDVFNYVWRRLDQKTREDAAAVVGTRERWRLRG